MLDKRAFKKAVNEGQFETVSKELNRYGRITVDKQFEIEYGYHAGHHRIKHYRHHDMSCSLEMHNGEIKAMGWVKD